MRFLNAILIKLCLGFCIGIYIGFTEGFEIKTLVYVLFGLLILLFFFKWVWQRRSAFLYTSVLLFMGLGFMTTALHLPENQARHLVHLDLNQTKALPIKAEINEILRANNYKHKFILDDINIEGEACRGKVLWQISKEHNVSDLYVGQKILMYSNLKKFQKPKNPQYFEYAGFMHNRNVYAVIDENHFERFPGIGFSLNAISAEQRQNIVLALRKAGFEEKHLELMQALILGQKQAINKDTYNDFAEAGVVHILAVSGLHVGIILVIIQYLFRPLLRFPKYGRPVLVILSILLLWCFAALAGFSPSVMRASTMFSFLAMGQLNRRKTNSINMLCLSALVLLLIKPQFLFEVGFQLSYAAVFAIVMLYPVFSKIYQPRYKIPKLFIDTAYVSLAAQIGVLPFQLYYFHQFPGLFLLGNIVVIPCLGVLLSGGILCIILSLLGILVSPLVKIYAWVLDALISFVEGLSAFKAFVIQDIFFTKPMFLALLAMVFLFSIMLREFKVKPISSFLIATLIFSMLTIHELAEIHQKSELVIFHQYKNSVIGIKQGNRLSVFSDTSKISKNDYFLKNYKLLNRIKSIEFQPPSNTFSIGSQKLLNVDSSGFYTSDFKADVLLLSGSPDVHLEKLIQQTEPKQIIVDGQNYRSNVERWQNTASDLNIAFHNTYEDGYISFSLP